MQAKFHPLHAVVDNAPKIVPVLCVEPLLIARLFRTVGAPASGTLAAGNGKYCATADGFIAAAGLQAAGSGYAAGDVLTVSGGTASTTCQITVDVVTSAGGVSDWHVSRVGVYSAYPTNAVSVTGGTGTGATFNLARQPADLCLDISNNVLYVCTTSGSSSTSAWTALGSAGSAQLFTIVSDGGDYWICSHATLGSTNVQKPQELKAGTNKLTTETIRGVTYSYSYAAVTVSSVITEYTRTVSGSDGTSETDYVTPPMIPGRVILGVPVAGSYNYAGAAAWAQ